MLAAGAVAALPLAQDANAHQKSRRQDKRPNVIFILMDDAGYGDFSCYGQTRTETPNIDALAANGIRFTDMYTACALSSPSRCCLLTGQHMGHSQIRDNKEYVDGKENPLVWDYRAVDMDPGLEGQGSMRPGTPTLGTMMKSAGYTTAMIGKWGLGGPLTESTPWNMGFDYYYGCICQRVAHNHYPLYYWENDKKVYVNQDVPVPGTGLDPGADPYDEASYEKFSKGKAYGPDLMMESIKGFVNENSDKPFFLMWTTPLPHSPLMAPKEWVDYYVKKYGDEEPLMGEFHQNQWPHNYFPCRYPHATYSAMIAYFDYQVGQLVEQLKELGIYENTLIIFTSDNGPANNASSPTVWMDSANPFRCGKGWGKATVQEGGLRMPFIASWPKKMKKGGIVSDHMGIFADVMPTLAEIVGVDAPVNDGVSLYPLLSGKPQKQGEHEFLYWEFPASKGLVAVRMGHWKGIVRDIKKGNSKMELYDISVPSKTVENRDNDVADQHPEIVAQMWEIVKSSHRDPADSFYQLDIIYPSK